MHQGGSMVSARYLHTFTPNSNSNRRSPIPERGDATAGACIGGRCLMVTALLIHHHRLSLGGLTDTT